MQKTNKTYIFDKEYLTQAIIYALIFGTLYNIFAVYGNPTLLNYIVNYILWFSSYIIADLILKKVTFKKEK